LFRPQAFADHELTGGEKKAKQMETIVFVSVNHITMVYTWNAITGQDRIGQDRIG
jgi:hypothetical protein